MYTKSSSTKTLSFPTDQIPENFHLRNSRIKRPANRIKQSSPLKSSKVLHTKPEKGHKYHPTLHNTKDLLLKSDIQFTTQAHEKLECYCNVCLAQNGVKIEPEEIPCDEFFRDFDFNNFSTKNANPEVDREFFFIIKRLMPRKKMTHTMRLTMPETLFFANGFPCVLVYPGKDKSLRFVNNKEKLALHEIRKFFQETFTKIEEEEAYASEQNDYNSQRKHSSVDMSSQDGALRSEHGHDSHSLGENIPSHILDLVDHKTIEAKRTVRRRQTRIRATTLTNQEVAMIKFIDDSTTILTDNEFESLMARKKFDPYWRKVAYIQIFKGLAKHIKTLQRVYFVLERESQHPLFQRASKEAHQYKGQLAQNSNQYIPAYEEENFERELRQTDEKTFCLYILMKIYHFMEAIPGIRIIKMGADFIRDEKGVLWLIDICRLHCEVIEIVKPASPERQRTVFPVYDEKSFEEEAEKRKEHVDFLVNMMKKKYEETKKEANLQIPPGRAYEEDLSDRVFSFLYPEMPVKLSTILKTNTKHAEFKRVFDNILVKTNFKRKIRKPEKFIDLPTEADQAPEEIIQEPQTIRNFNPRPSLGRGSSVTARKSYRENSILEYSNSAEKTLTSIGHVELNRSISKGRIVYQPVDMKEKAVTRTSSQPSLRKVVRGVGLKHRVSPIMKRNDQVITEPSFISNRNRIAMNVQRNFGGFNNPTEDNPPPTERILSYRENLKGNHKSQGAIKIEYPSINSREKLTARMPPEAYKKLLEPINLFPSLLSNRSQEEVARNLIKNKH